jgi:hypothetical protein
MKLAKRLACFAVMLAVSAWAQSGPQREPDLSSPARARRPATTAANDSEAERVPTLRRAQADGTSPGARKAGRKAVKQPPAPAPDPAVVAARAAEYERQHQRDMLIFWSIVAVVLAAYFGLCLGVGYAARQKGRSMSSYTLLSLLLSPLLALIILLIAGEDKEVAAVRSGRLVHCPICGEWIQRLAVKCRFCGSDLNRSGFAGMRGEERQRIIEDEYIRLGASTSARQNAGLTLLGFAFVIGVRVACWLLFDLVSFSILAITVVIAFVIMILWLAKG